MLAKHTPGPWHAVDYAGFFTIQKETFYGLDGDLLDVGCFENAKENALLAAAAPDLLKALIAVVSVADRRTVEFDKAKAAIAKAEGRENV